MIIAVVDYGIKKDDPLVKLLEELKINFEVTNNESAILRADKIILPHTEKIELAIKLLHLLNLFTMLRVCKKPMLGISAGMHLMCSNTKEGNQYCLSIFPTTVEMFNESDSPHGKKSYKELLLLMRSKLFEDLTGEEKYFFDHSFYVPVNKFTSAATGQFPIFSAAIEKDGYFGVQFLPEKSGNAGISLIKNFYLMA